MQNRMKWSLVFVTLFALMLPGVASATEEGEIYMIGSGGRQGAYGSIGWNHYYMEQDTQVCGMQLTFDVDGMFDEGTGITILDNFCWISEYYGLFDWDACIEGINPSGQFSIAAFTAYDGPTLAYFMPQLLGFVSIEIAEDATATTYNWTPTGTNKFWDCDEVDEIPGLEWSGGPVVISEFP